MTSQSLGKAGRTSRCVRSSRMLQSYLDGELDSPSAVERVGEHLDECRRCGLSAATYRAIKQALRSRSHDIDELTLRRLHGFTRSLARCGGGPEEMGRTPDGPARP
jgi:putative zinc finger protein